MKSKLTLSMDPEVVLAAKRMARQMGTSISALLEAYLRGLTETQNTKRKYQASKFLQQIPAKEPSYPYDDKSDDQWLEENLEQ